MKKRFFFLLLAFLTVPLAAQDKTDQQDPDWLLYRKGIQEMKNKELGNALTFFKKAIDARTAFPEAEMAIGDIYYIEGEYDLAELQYRKAYGQKTLFDIPDEKYSVLYRLVDIYINRTQYKKSEDTCMTILKENPKYFTDIYGKYKTVFYNLFFSKGFDRTLVLYRLSNPEVVRAHSELAKQCYNEGRYEESVTHSLFSLNIILTVCISEYRREDPEFEYKNLGDFLKLLANQKTILEYIKRTDLYGKLYYLAAASYALNRKTRAVALWKIISQNGGAGRFRDLSLKQLKSPWIEDYIDVLPEKIEYTIEEQ